MEEGERKNQIRDKAYQAVIAEMKEQMLGWYQESCDTIPPDENDRFPEECYFASLLSGGAPPSAVEAVKAILRTQHRTPSAAMAILMQQYTPPQSGTEKE